MKTKISLILALMIISVPVFASGDYCTFSQASENGVPATDGTGTLDYFPSTPPANMAVSYLYHAFGTDGVGNTLDFAYGSGSAASTKNPSNGAYELKLGAANDAPLGVASVHVDAQGMNLPLVESSTTFQAFTPGTTVVAVFYVDSSGIIHPLTGATIAMVNDTNGAQYMSGPPTQLRPLQGNSSQMAYTIFGKDPTGQLQTDCGYAPGVASQKYHFTAICPGYSMMTPSGSPPTVDAQGSYWPYKATYLIMSQSGSASYTAPSASPVLNPEAPVDYSPCNVPAGSLQLGSTGNTITGFTQIATNSSAVLWLVTLSNGQAVVDHGNIGSAGANGFEVTSATADSSCQLNIPATIPNQSYNLGSVQYQVQLRDSSGWYQSSNFVIIAPLPPQCAPGYQQAQQQASSANFMSGFWGDFIKFMQSLFVPQQSTINSLQATFNSITSWGPLGFFKSFYADILATFLAPNSSTGNPNYWYIPLWFHAYILSPTDTSSQPIDINTDTHVPESGSDTTGVVVRTNYQMYSFDNPSGPPDEAGGGGGMFPNYLDLTPLAPVIPFARVMLAFATWGAFALSMIKWTIPALRIKIG